MGASEDKQGYVLYRNWTPVICSLSDEEAGQLFKAIARYQEGDNNDLGQGYLSGIFAMMKLTFAADRAKYEKIREQRSVAGQAGGKASGKSRAKKGGANEANEAFASTINRQEANEADMEMGKGFEKVLREDPLTDSKISDPVRDKLREWIVYKQEMRKSYKPQGLKALLSRAEKAEEAHGHAAVVALIEDAMAAGYQGIVWEKLERANSRPGYQRQPVKSNQFTSGVENNEYDFDALERDLIVN